MSPRPPALSALAREWRTIANALGLEIVTPFWLPLPDGRTLEIDVLLKNFGAQKGMLLVSDQSKVWSDRQAIEDAGYGFSVLNVEQPGVDIDLEVVREVLRDWGWSGPPEDEPAWMRDS